MTSRRVQTQLTEEQVRDLRKLLVGPAMPRPRIPDETILALADAYLAQREALEFAEGNFLSARECLAHLTGSVVLEVDFPGLGEQVAGALAWINGGLDVVRAVSAGTPETTEGKRE